jgi:hypothetical protein
MIQKPSDFKTNLFIDGSYVEATRGRLTGDACWSSCYEDWNYPFLRLSEFMRVKFRITG